MGRVFTRTSAWQKAEPTVEVDIIQRWCVSNGTPTESAHATWEVSARQCINAGGARRAGALWILHLFRPHAGIRACTSEVPVPVAEQIRQIACPLLLLVRFLKVIKVPRVQLAARVRFKRRFQLPLLKGSPV